MKAKNYRSLERPYVREEFIHGAPQPRIAKFTYGKMQEHFDHILELIPESSLQVRDVALESARVTAGKMLSNKIGSNFYLELRAYPHHVLRENKMIFGAHADRLQEGMSRAFGRPVGRAAQIKAGKPVIVVYTTAGNVEVVKDALRTASKKLPGSYKIEVRKLSEVVSGVEQAG